MKFSRKLLILPPVVLGALVLQYSLSSREEPAPADQRERAVAVRVLDVAASSVVPRAVGYGVVEPARTWRALAEVSGRVISIHPRLAVGEILPEGTELLRLDPTEYELRVARLEADLRSTEAEQAKLDVGVVNTRSSLAVAQQTLDLAERELGRLEELATSGNVSTSSVEAQEQLVLRERATVVELENSIRTAEADQQVFEARIASTQAQLDETRLQLDRTVFTAPFDFRISSVDVEDAQFVSTGAVLLEADGIDVAEVQVNLGIERVRNLIRPEDREGAVLTVDGEELWSRLGLDATVRLRGGGFDYAWPARFARVAGFLDSKTRTVSMVAAVDDAYRGAAGEPRPPLAKGMFVEVEFVGEELTDRIVIPLSAVHGGRVYVADSNDRLVIRSVDLDFVQFDDAIVASGIEAGERLVLTDLIPAIPGMLLAPTGEAR